MVRNVMGESSGRLSYSYMSLYRNCERAFYHRYRQGIGLRGGSPPYLTTGSALHAGTDSLWMDGWDLEVAEHALLTEWGDYVTPRNSDLGYMTEGHALNILRCYYEREPFKGIEPIKLLFDDLNFSVLEKINATVNERGELYMNEVPLGVRLPFNGEELRFTAKVDFPAMGATGPTIIDRKCKVGWLNEWSIAKSIGVNHQLRLYTYIMRELTGMPFDTGMIEGIYIGEYATDDEAKWAKRKSVPFKMFGPFIFSDAELEETLRWASQTQADIARRDEMQAELESEYPELAWPQNDKGGCGSCEFKDLCDLPDFARPAAVRQGYEERGRFDTFGKGNK